MVFLTTLNLNRNELQNAVIQNLSADPSAANSKVGMIYYNTVTKLLRQYDGTNWVDVGAAVPIATYDTLGKLKVDVNTLTIDNNGLLAVKTPTDNNFTTGYKEKLDNIESGAEVNDLENISLNGTPLEVTSKTIALTTSFVDDSTSTPNSPVKLTVSDGNPNHELAFGNIPKVSSSSAGVAPKGATVSTQSQSTKFLREDGTWAAPSYTDGSAYVKKDGSVAMTNFLDMGTHIIKNVVDPTNPQEAATKKYVDDQISSVSGGMVFRGTIGTNGTAGTTLPTTNVKIGDTYKIITDGTYAGQVAKAGDLFIATATTPTWAYVPAGDEPSGTVTQISTGSGLSGGPITTSGTISLASAYGDTVNPYGSKTKNYVLAAPSDANGTPSFRKLVAGDIPDLSATYKTVQTAVSDPQTTTGAVLQFIASISQDTNGVITPVKRAVAVDSTITEDSNNPVSSGAVYDAISAISGSQIIKKSEKNPALTASGGVWTWTITALAHTPVTSDISVTVYEVASGAMVIPDVTVNQSTGVITITITDTASAGNLAANTYKAVIIG